MATTTPESMAGMVAVSSPGVKALGYLTWYSVPDESVSLRTLKKQLALHALPPQLAPDNPRAINTFKKAMREQEGKHRTNGHTVETEVAFVEETRDDCVYQVSQLTRDLKERVVDYPKGLRVIFNKNTEEIRFNPLKEVPTSEVRPIMEAIDDFYENNASRISGARVRTVVRKYLRNEPDEARGIEGLSGENLRGKSGGIYFIPADGIDQLTALSECLAELYKGKAYLHAVPMADTASEREIIRRHHVANARSEIQEAIGEARGLLSGDRDRNVRSNVVAHHYSRYHAIRRRAAKYADLLADEQEEMDDMQEMLKNQIDKLL